MDAAPRSIWGAPVDALQLGSAAQLSLFLLLAFILVGSAKNPLGLGMIYNRSNPLGNWVRVCSVLPVIWAVNWNDQGMCIVPPLDP